MGPQGARSAFSGCHSQSEPIFPVSNSPGAPEGWGEPPAAKSPPSMSRAPPCTLPRSATSLARAVSRRPPYRYPPCVVRSPTPFSARSQHTRSPACVCCICQPLALFSFQRHSTQHVLHYWSPFDLVTAFAGPSSSRGGLYFLNVPHICINNRPLKTSLSYAKLKLNRRIGRWRKPVLISRPVVRFAESWRSYM
jgi:hypothetical protein